MTCPRIVAFASYGNDSIALLQWLHKRKHGRVLVLHNDTGWAAPWWEDRVHECEEWVVDRLGYEVDRTQSEGMYPLAQRKKGWPAGGRLFQFCTTELKIVPTRAWLEANDPDKDAILANGVRREESKERGQWPEHSESEVFPGYEMWSPLVRVREAERNDLVSWTPIPLLPHRSMECWPCVNANRTDIRLLTPERVANIGMMEKAMGSTRNGHLRTFFRPKRHKGAVGMERVYEWANGELETDQGLMFGLGSGSGCDSGMCAS